MAECQSYFANDIYITLLHYRNFCNTGNYISRGLSLRLCDTEEYRCENGIFRTGFNPSHR